MKHLKKFENYKNKLKIYFAHPISIYGTEYEKEIIKSLSNKYEVLNPSEEKYQNGIKEYKEK